MNKSEMRGEYQGRKVLVTGADGFMGSHLVERLLMGGASVAIVVRPSSINGTVGFYLKNLSHVAGEFEKIIAADIAGEDVCEKIVDWQPDIIFHLAADAYVERSFKYPSDVLRTNIGGTERVLAAALRCKNITRVVVTSSSEIYGGTRFDKIDEDHPLEPSSPYAASKVAADRIAYSYFRTFNLPVAIIRPFNTFGPRHVYDVIPKFVRQALKGQPLVIYGTGLQMRDFTFVNDMVEAFWLMGTHSDAIGREVNFGSESAISIAELANVVGKLTGNKSQIVSGPPRAAEVECLRCDASRAKKLFGWYCKVSLEEGISRHIDWQLRQL